MRSSGARFSNGRTASQQLVERHAERVEVAAKIDGSTGSTGLLRRDVRQRAREHIAVVDVPPFVLEQHRDAEIGQEHVSGVGLQQNVRGLDVAMHDSGRVRALEDVGQLRRNGPEHIERERLPRAQTLPGSRREPARATRPAVRRPRRRSRARTTPFTSRLRISSNSR